MKLCCKYLIPPILVGAVALSLILTGAPALAGLRVSGARLLADVAPGETITHTMIISIGESDAATDILVDVTGFGQSLDGSPQELDAAEDTSPYSARTFITLDKTSFHLDPGDSQVVTATIKVPEDVGAGGRYALIYIRTQPVGEGQVGIVSAIDVPILLTISHTELTYTGSINDLSVGDVIAGQPIVISTTLKNTGNHHFKIKGEVTISNSQGEILETIRTPLSTWSLMPTLLRQLKATFIPEGELPLGNCSVKSKVMLEDGTILDEATASFEVKEPYVPPVPPACVTVTPGSPATLETTDGRIRIAFPKGSVTGEAEVCVENYPSEKLSGPPSGFELATTCFRVDGLSGLLAKDATLTVKYSDADLGRAGGDVSQLSLARWDEANNEWSVLKTEVDSQAMTLTTTTNQLSIWAVMVGAPAAPPLPVAMNWRLLAMIIGGGVLLVIIIVLLVLLLRRRRDY